MWRNISKKLEDHQYTVWTQFTPLSIKHNSVNIGQGFPGFPVPDFVKQALKDSTDANENQYSRSMGTLPLVQQLAERYSAQHNREINPLTEVVVCMGATEGLACTLLGTVDPGDEVLMIEPFFDLYHPQTSAAGGIPRTVSLVPPEPGSDQWTIDFGKLEAAFNERTRAFIFNNPQNPIGKVYTREQVQKIADILSQWPNVTIISDEVYEHLTFDGLPHFCLSDFNDLWERTITWGSAGKVFSVTGWKVGWGIGGADVVKKVATARMWTSYCSNTVCQGAIARSLETAKLPYQGFPNYFEWLRHEYQQKRDIVMSLFQRANRVSVRMLKPEGGFFACGYIEEGQIAPEFLENASPDFAFCRWMTISLKVSAIPCSVFFTPANKHLGDHLVRFALCKDYADYEAAEKILVINP